jgi:hypothetical protein
MSVDTMSTRTIALRLAPLTLALLASAPLAARADGVTDWSRAMTETPLGGPPQRARIEAMASLAMHDALNAIDARYESYSVIPAAPAGASPDAAAATAARDVLIASAPAQAAALQARYVAYMATLPACPVAQPTCIADGVQAGANAAAAILALRLNDGSATPDIPYAAPLVAGMYQPTPGQPTPRNEGWQFVRPFGIRSADQFRADDSPIMHLDSDTYARDFNEVKSVGDAAVRSAAPDSVQSDVARFWPGGGADWNSTTRTIVNGLGMDRWQHARLFALLNMANADAAIAVYDTKYHYRYWRPVTAIRFPDDGNAATTSDAGWTPLLVTPPYPDYTCGLTTAAGANTEVLRRFFGTDAVPYTLTINAAAVTLPAPLVSLPPKAITRSFATLSEAAADAVDARVFAGIHFRTGCVQGVRHGEKVGRFVIQHWLRPLK